MYKVFPECHFLQAAWHLTVLPHRENLLSANVEGICAVLSGYLVLSFRNLKMSL